MTLVTQAGQLTEPTLPRRRRQLAPGDRVVVCGGGPAGLTAAYVLAQKGYAVRVIEADDVVGGISRTARYKDYRFDIGGHRFFTKIKAVEDFWEAILGDQLVDVPRLSRILYNGRYFHYPLKAVNAITGLGLLEAARIIVSYIKARISPEPREDNFEQWVSNRFGSRLYQIFFKTYTEKVWGIPCTDIRAEWAAQRIQGLSLAQAILSATTLNRRSTTIKTLINQFRYPRLGPGQMWEMCAQRIVEMGGVVSTGSRVRSFSREKNSIRSVEVETATGNEVVEAEHFISTIPLANLARSLGDKVPTSIAKAADGLTYRDFIVVALILDGERLFPDNWIYVHTPGVSVGRIQNFNNWSADMVPVKGVTCLGMEYFCFEGDGLWNHSDAELITLATNELTKLKLASSAKVIDGVVVRMPKAYPIYDAEYHGHVDTIRSHLDSLNNIQTVGRNGMHKYNNQDHSMYTAMLAVENMLGADHDVWSVNTDLDYQEEQRLPEPAVSLPAGQAG